MLDTVDASCPTTPACIGARGTSLGSSTAAFERARDHVGEFVGADPDRDVVVFTKNTTEAINKLARSLPLRRDAVVLTTMLEHHSNELPWRAPGPRRARPLPATARWTRTISIASLAATPGASPSSPSAAPPTSPASCQPIHRLAEKVHAAGGRILVDAAQLAAHRPIDMRPHDDPGHLDFVALSAHKMYAPFGTGR